MNKPTQLDITGQNVPIGDDGMPQPLTPFQPPQHSAVILTEWLLMPWRDGRLLKATIHNTPGWYRLENVTTPANDYGTITIQVTDKHQNPYTLTAEYGQKIIVESNENEQEYLLRQRH